MASAGSGGTSNNDSDEGPGDGYVHPFWIAILAIVLVAIATALIAALVIFWPAATVTGASPTGTGSTNISLFGLNLALARDAQLFVTVAIAGALGGVIHSLRSFYWYVGNRALRSSWVLGYFLMPVIAAALGTLVYVVLRAGLISPQSGTDSLSPFGFAAVAGLVGLFSDQAASKLKDIFEVIFTKAPPGKDQAHALEITEIAPPSGRVGSELVIRGSGFDSGVLVRFTGADARPTVRTDTEIRVKVPVGAVTGPVTLVRGSASAVSTSDFQVLP